MRVTHRSLLTSVSIIGLCVANVLEASDSTGQSVMLRKHGDWWLGLDAGAGAIHLELPEGKVSENKFYLGVRAEYILSPEFLLGIEASGWLIQPGEIEYNTNPPPNNFDSQVEGEGLAPVLLTARYYPWDDSSWYLKAGAGYVSHWQTTQGVTERESGSGAMLGGGYDFMIKEALINSSMNYQSAKKGKCDFPLFFICNDLLVIANGSTSLCCGNSELIRVSLMKTGI